MKNLRTPEVEALLRVLVDLRDEDTAFSLMEDLFTIREIRESSQRLAVARMLDEGRSYAKIEQATGASATTIARVSKCLSYGAGGYRAAIDLLAEAGKAGEAGEVGEAEPGTGEATGAAEADAEAAEAGSDAAKTDRVAAEDAEAGCGTGEAPGVAARAAEADGAAEGASGAAGAVGAAERGAVPPAF